MDYAIISGDIVASTSLSGAGKKLVEEALQNLLKELKTKFNVFGRIIKGDYLECYVPDLIQVLRVALAIKSFVKSIDIDNTKDGIGDQSKVKLFKTHGIRLAIGIGEMSRVDTENGILDGEAIYFSGRMISQQKTSDKEKVSVKKTLFLKTRNDDFDSLFEPVLALIDVIMGKSTPKQCRVIYFKLLGYDEKKICDILSISQSTINQHSTSAGWHAIEKSVRFFEKKLHNKELSGLKI